MLHVVPGGNDVSLQRVGRGAGRVANRHHTLIEGPGGVVAVVAADAQEDGPRLAHRVVVDTAAVVVVRTIHDVVDTLGFVSVVFM